MLYTLLPTEQPLFQTDIRIYASTDNSFFSVFYPYYRKPSVHTCVWIPWKPLALFPLSERIFVEYLILYFFSFSFKYPEKLFAPIGFSALSSHHRQYAWYRFLEVAVVFVSSRIYPADYIKAMMLLPDSIASWRFLFVRSLSEKR